jgi:hypothetical protein
VSSLPSSFPNLSSSVSKSSVFKPSLFSSIPGVQGLHGYRFIRWSAKSEPALPVQGTFIYIYIYKYIYIQIYNINDAIRITKVGPRHEDPGTSRASAPSSLDLETWRARTSIGGSPVIGLGIPMESSIHQIMVAGLGR